MKTIKLIILLFTALLAQDLSATPVPQIIEEEPDFGGWHVAYSNEVTEKQAAQGYVNFQLSLFSGDAEIIESWADFMLRQAVALMVHKAGPELADQFTPDEQQHAGRFGVATIKKLLRSKQSGYEQKNFSSLVVKAGVTKRGGKFIPYFALRLRPASAPIEQQLIVEYQKNIQYQVQADQAEQVAEEVSYPTQAMQMPPALPAAHVWEYLSSFGAEPEDYATYSYVLTGRNGGSKYIDLVNYIQESTASANEMAESIPPEELNIFLIPSVGTDDTSHKPDYESSRKLLAVLSARTKLNFDRPGPYIITTYQPISKIKKGADVDMLYVDMTNINQGAAKELVRMYKKTVLKKKLNGMDKLYSLRLAFLNLAFMTEESIGFAKTASASLDPIFSGGGN
uniref:hypothetical protein n=1 Tax=Candidatus Electronema sp. TaxID=2698783 RepID=UPI00405700CB